MERTRAKILRNSQQLQEEYEAVQQLLNPILEKNKNAIRDIGNLTDRDMLLNKKFCLNIIEFQDMAIQKMLSMQIDIDEFANQINSVNLESAFSSPKSSLTFTSLSLDLPSSLCKSCGSGTPTNEELSKQVFPNLQTEHIQYKNIVPNNEEVKVNVLASEPEKPAIISELKEYPSIEIPCVPVIANSISENTLQEQSLEITLTNNEIVENIKEEIIENINEVVENICEVIENTDQIVEHISQDSQECTDDIQDLPNSNSSENMPEMSEKTIIGQNTSDSLTESEREGSKKSSADISSTEEISPKLEFKKVSVQEKLKSKKLMTRRDRYLQNIQRPVIPDLTLKPSGKLIDSNESYTTCQDASSSSERPRRKRIVTNTVAETETNNKNTIKYKEPVPPYRNMSCLISRMVSPSDFYINHVDDNIGEIDLISHQLAEIYKQTSSPYPDKKTAMEQLGNNCVCYVDSYQCWYRVTVTNWRLKAKVMHDQIDVYLVDYGHTCVTTYTNLRELSVEFCRIPQCAIKCHLIWLYPPGSTKDHLLEIWPKKSLEYFGELVKDDAIYKVVYGDKCGNSWGIDLVRDSDDDDSNTLGQCLIDNNMAVEILYDATSLIQNDFFLQQIQTAHGLAGITQGMSNAEKLERFHENTGEREFDNIDDAMLRYKANDEARTCKYARNGTCFKGKKCKLDHGKLRPDGYTTDKQCIYVSAFKQLDMPCAGSTVKLRITNIVTVNSFYAYLVNSHSDGLKNLITLMNKPDTITKYKPLNIIPARGEVVIAKSWNKSWYRAQVKDVYQYQHRTEETIKVFMVDLGEEVDTKFDDLKTITPEFLDLPFQAIFCRLFNVQPIEDQGTEEAKSYCEEHFLSQIFNADVKYSSHSILEVLLRKQNCEDLGEQIIEDGWGELRTRHEFPTETLLVD